MLKTERKTLFIVLDLGSAIRNIMRTDVFKILRAAGLRIVIFSPITDEEFMKEFGGEDIVIESVPKWKPNRLVKLLRSFKKDIWIVASGVHSFRLRRRKKRFRLFPLAALSRIVSFRRLQRGIDALEALLTPPLARQVLKKYSPSLIFYTNLYASNPCIELAAQKALIRTVCLIHSWDNPTTKGPFPVTPDKLIVWNRILRDEVVSFHHYPAENIFLSGIPQFDLYLDTANFLPKEEFFRKLGLSPDKKLLTYTTGSTIMFPFEDEIVEILVKAVQERAFREPVQLLIRPHPKDSLELYSRFEDVPGVVIQRPGRPSQAADKWNPTNEDMYALAELMKYSDVVINIASTITLDAAAFDTPVVNVSFDGYQRLPFWKSSRRIYTYEHYRNIVKTGGVRIAETREELVEHINSYLANPALDAAGREKIREEQFWKFDGQSGRRIAEYVLQELNRTS